MSQVTQIISKKKKKNEQKMKDEQKKICKKKSDLYAPMTPFAFDKVMPREMHKLTA